MAERIIGDELKHSKKINQTLCDDSEKSLWSFANTPLRQNELKTWKARFQSFVISRLHNTHDTNSYFQSISMTIHSLKKTENKDEEMIALYSALLSYDFSHFDKLPDDTPYYNKTVLMRLLLSHRTDQNQIGETIQKCLDGMTLDTISRPLLNTKLKLHNAERKKDCELLFNIALERIETEKNQAQLILDTVVKACIKQWGKGNNEYDAVDNLLQYSEQSREYIFKKLYEENHPYITPFFTLYEKYKDQTPAPTDLVYKKNTIKGIQTLFKQSICIQKIYNEMKEKITHQQAQARLEAEKQKTRAEQEELKKSQSKTAEFFFETIPDLKGRSFEINTVPDDFEYITSIIKNQTVMTHQTSALFYQHDKMNRPISLNELFENIYFLISDKSFISVEQKEQLKQIFENNQDRLLEESETTYLTKAIPLACKYLWKLYIISPEEILDDDISRFVTNFNFSRFSLLYNGTQKQKDSLNQTADSHAYAINEIVKTLQQIDSTIKKNYDTAQRRNEKQKQKAEQKRVKDEQRKKQAEKKQNEEELQKNIYELKKERVLEEIEHKAEYLKKLYELHTGLDLHHVDVEALDESGTTIGSVSVGLSQRPSLSQRQELTLEQRLEFRSKRDLIELAVGEDTEKIIQRFSMIDWVAPHEIAHLIDWASNHFTEKLLENQIMQNKIETIVRTIDPVKQELAKEMIALSFKESLIDGIGFYCASEYGTSDITHDQDRKKRKQDISTAFSTTMEIVKTIIREEAHDEESQSRYQIILLRMIAVSKQISEDQKTTTLLEALFQQLNKETNMVSDEQKNKLLAFFSEAFDGGRKFLKEAIL